MFILTRLSQVVSATEMKSVSPLFVQVRNQLNDRSFFSGRHFDIDSCMVPSPVHQTGHSQVVTTTESKSVSLGVGSKYFCGI
jgi:hypothetical protein